MLGVLGCGLDEATVVDDSSSTTATDESSLSSSLMLSHAAVSLSPGGQATVVASFGGNAGVAWFLSTAGLPPGVTGVFSSPSITGGQHATLTLTATAQASATTVSALVHAITAHGSTRSATLSVAVASVSTGGGGGGSTGGGSAGGNGGGTGGASGIGPLGGTVDLLRFAVTGDTRPPACEDNAHYPTAVINGIADGAQARGAQFGLDLGDHMYVCNSSLAEATIQMNMYMQAIHRFSNQWFMTMGNHECWHGPCLPGSSSANYVAFMSALSQVSSLPYYTFNVHTRHGLATFIVLADNAWDSTQSAWFERTLATADTAATYTIVARHHPEGDTSVVTNPEAVTILRRHKFALFLTGHAHSYKHMTTDNGRDVVIGIGGAPLLAAGSTFNGYAMVEQQATGELRMNVYNITGNTLHETFTVAPNQ